MSGKSLKEWAPVFLAAVALVASGAALFVERTTDVKESAVKERLARVEAHLEDMKNQLNRIELRVDSR